MAFVGIACDLQGEDRKDVSLPRNAAVVRDAAVSAPEDGGIDSRADAGAPDCNPCPLLDTGRLPDAGLADVQPGDVRETDAAPPGDAMGLDVARSDVAVVDVAVPDTEAPDAAADVAVPDTEAPDAVVPDAHQPDAAPPDVVVLDAVPPDSGAAPRRKIAILFVGDGMGQGALDAASCHAHGRRGALGMQLRQSFPFQGELRTASLSGVTDSAASATTMATGIKTLNGQLGLDWREGSVSNVVERASERGLGTGVVTTATISHATPAGFTVHYVDRGLEVPIADQLAEAPLDVLLGGGAGYFRAAGDDSYRDDAGLIAQMQHAGYTLVETAAALADADQATRLLGLFNMSHMTYMLDRAPDSTEPTLAEMTTAALQHLDRNPHGFFLMVEGARIDMAGHDNDHARQVQETLAFDEAIAVAVEWVESHEAEDDVLVLVTADHETGALAVSECNADARWGRDRHSNQLVPIFARGAAGANFDGATFDNSCVHTAIDNHLEGRNRPCVDPVNPVPDGDLRDLSCVLARQTKESDYGSGHNRMDTLRIGFDDHGLVIGIEGLFEAEENALVVLLDPDYDPNNVTGVVSLEATLTDEAGVIDNLLSTLQLQAPADPGFGADQALVSIRATDRQLGELADDAGLRGLGRPNDLPWREAAINFSWATVVVDGPAEVRPNEGFEAGLPWSVLYPDQPEDTPVSPGSRIAIVALLTNTVGNHISNQFLPPLPDDLEGPGGGAAPLPGYVVIPIDVDQDGQPDMPAGGPCLAE